MVKSHGLVGPRRGAHAKGHVIPTKNAVFWCAGQAT
jgi:hypothetical protein